MIRVGWCVGWLGAGGAAPGELSVEGATVRSYERSEPGALTAYDVDVWVVEADADLRDAVARSSAPIVLRADVGDASGWWWPLVEQGRVDVVARDASPVELRARVLGAARSALGWNRLADRLATTAAHDLRSPLQGLRFILASLESPEATPEDRAEDLSMLRAVADTIEVQLHGLYDLGRRLASEQGERVDVVEVLREELLRPMFAERIEFTGPASASVLANAADIRYALLDLLRVSAQVGPGSKRVVLQVVEDGDAWVLRLEIAVYAVIGPHLDALLRREGALLLRGKARLPFAGLAFPYEVVAAAGGTLVLELAGPERLVVRVRLPRVSEG